MGSLDDSNGVVSHGNSVENANTKLTSMNELLQQHQNAPTNPNHSRQRLGGLLAFLPETGRHYVYNREAWIAAEEERRKCSGSSTSQHRRSKKQQRRFERRQLDTPLTTTDSSISSSNTAGAIRIVSLCNCLLYHKENSASAATEMTTTATVAVPAHDSIAATHGTADPRTTSVICLALLDPQHQPWSRQVLSRLVTLCAINDDPEPETLLSMDDNDDNAAKTTRIHGWVLLQSAAMSSQSIDYWFAHSGLTVLVCDDSNDVPMEPRATESSHNTVTPCAVVDPATTAAAAAANAIADATTCAHLFLSPAPLSTWLWTALGMHHCPAVTILNGHTGRRCQTQQERLLLDASKSDAAIRKAWIHGPCPNDDRLSLSLISTCTVQ
jgi:hypothetical protein